MNFLTMKTAKCQKRRHIAGIRVRMSGFPYLTTYSYDAETGEINTTYGMWDKKKKSFSLNVQNMVAPATSYNDIFS